MWDGPCTETEISRVLLQQYTKGSGRESAIHHVQHSGSISLAVTGHPLPILRKLVAGLTQPSLNPGGSPYEWIERLPGGEAKLFSGSECRSVTPTGNPESRYYTENALMAFAISGAIRSRGRDARH